MILWLLWWPPTQSHYDIYDYSAIDFVTHARCIVLLCSVGNEITITTYVTWTLRRLLPLAIQLGVWQCNQADNQDAIKPPNYWPIFLIYFFGGVGVGVGVGGGRLQSTGHVRPVMRITFPRHYVIMNPDYRSIIWGWFSKSYINTTSSPKLEEEDQIYVTIWSYCYGKTISVSVSDWNITAW